MNWKKLLVPFIAVYVVYHVLGYLIHQVWLGPVYQSLAHLWRPEAEMLSKTWIMFVTSVFFCFFFVYIFARGCEKKGILEGVRYGVIIGLFVGVMMSYDWYVILAIPYSLALKWFLSWMVTTIVLGIVAALTYKPE